MFVELNVDSHEAGERLDRFLTARLESMGDDGLGGLTRSQIKRALDQGAAEVDGRRGRAGQRLKPRQIVRFTPPPPEPLSVEPEPIPLSIAFEDDRVVVVDKPAGMVVHPAPGHRRGTLVAALLAHCPLSGGDPLRPGIVHRLDRDTTGLLVVAKDVVALEHLARQFRDHTVGRRYLALVRGHPALRGTIRTAYGRHPHHRLKFTGRFNGSKQAVTHFERLEAFSSTRAAALVACTLETGRTHQVRVHLSEAGHPLLGDPLYGGGSGGDHRLEPALSQLDRQALHATHLAFDHPGTGARIELDSPPPVDFERALAGLREIP